MGFIAYDWRNKAGMRIEFGIYINVRIFIYNPQDFSGGFKDFQKTQWKITNFKPILDFILFLLNFFDL